MGQSASACGGVVGGGGVMPGRRQVAQCRGRINLERERRKEAGGSLCSRVRGGKEQRSSQLVSQ